MKIAYLIYLDVLEDRVTKLLNDCDIQSYFEWENVAGKFRGQEGHFGTRAYPGLDKIKLIPTAREEKFEKLISLIKEFNDSITKKSDEIRMYLLPLEQII
ncbi:MAG: hypothetical protein K8H86_08740 [Ignavibacteriaceae bacterium]|nr:hypothetical protein [Ignavibacteriaceae bacterium]